MTPLPTNKWVPDYQIRIRENNGEWGKFSGVFLWTKFDDPKQSAIDHYKDNMLNSRFLVLAPDDELSLFGRLRKWTGKYKDVKNMKNGKSYETKEVLHSDWEFFCDLNGGS